MDEIMALLLESVILCGLFTALILPPLYRNPLSQIANYPAAIRARVEVLPRYRDALPQVKSKKRARKIVFVVIAVFALASLAYFSGKRTFGAAFVHLFFLAFAVNLYDLIVLDILIFCRDKRLRIPGTEDMEREYRNPAHHIKSAVKGTAVSVILAVPAAGLVALTNLLLKF
ncbi:MAG: hypothetical protein LBK57_02805 [Clostridiales Family XIII bacterium]|jgi:hypothetical protein|nr:hypothetical protein [Clostridiales Family XIII bacterium]